MARKTSKKKGKETRKGTKEEFKKELSPTKKTERLLGNEKLFDLMLKEEVDKIEKKRDLVQSSAVQETIKREVKEKLGLNKLAKELKEKGIPEDIIKLEIGRLSENATGLVHHKEATKEIGAEGIGGKKLKKITEKNRKTIQILAKLADRKISKEKAENRLKKIEKERKKIRKQSKRNTINKIDKMIDKAEGKQKKKLKEIKKQFKEEKESPENLNEIMYR